MTLLRITSGCIRYADRKRNANLVLRNIKKKFLANKNLPSPNVVQSYAKDLRILRLTPQNDFAQDDISRVKPIKNAIHSKKK